MNMVNLGPKGLQGRPMSTARPGVITALDVGSHKISCFIAKVEPGRAVGGHVPFRAPIRVIGIGHQISRGIRGGVVIDMDGAEEAIRVAVDAAERMAGLTVRDVVVNVSCGEPQSQIVSVKSNVQGAEVDDHDLSRAIAHGQRCFQPEGREVLHTIPVNYAIDGARGVRDPRGMYGEKIGVDMHMVSAQRNPLRNLVLCIERCHLDIAGMSVSPYASGLACLVEDEIDLGVTVIDMGAGTTSLAVFFEGNMMFCASVPVGGMHITNDIARGLSTPVTHAERMKSLYGSALASPADEREMIDVPQVGETGSDSANHIPRSILTGIIQPRLEETLEMVRDKLEASGFAQVAGRRVVLTGGASQLNGARELAARILDKQVRIGAPIKVTGLADATGGPAFATCAGLLNYSQVSPVDNATSDKETDAPMGGQFRKIGRWLKENF